MKKRTIWKYALCIWYRDLDLDFVRQDLKTYRQKMDTVLKIKILSTIWLSGENNQINADIQMTFRGTIDFIERNAENTISSTIKSSFIIRCLQNLFSIHESSVPFETSQIHPCLTELWPFKISKIVIIDFVNTIKTYIICHMSFTLIYKHVTMT